MKNNNYVFNNHQNIVTDPHQPPHNPTFEGASPFNISEKKPLSRLRTFIVAFLAGSVATVCFTVPQIPAAIHATLASVVNLMPLGSAGIGLAAGPIAWGILALLLGVLLTTLIYNGLRRFL